MNGNEEYELRIERRIKCYLTEHSYLKSLKGFVNDIYSDSSYITIYEYERRVGSFLKYINKKEENITYDDYKSYMASLKKTTSSNQILSYSALKKYSTYLMMSGYSKIDYMKDVKPPKKIEKIETKEKREKGYLTKSEITKYINNVKKEINKSGQSREKEMWAVRDLTIITLLLSTGMRCSALFKLNIDNVDLIKKRIITIDKEEKIEEHFISQELCDLLEKWIFYRKLLLSNNDTDALFISSIHKERLVQKGISDIVKKYAYNIEGKNITPHKLRATYGTQIYENTHDLYMVQQCMGHSSPTTSELYIRGKKNEGREKASTIMGKMIF